MPNRAKGQNRTMDWTPENRLKLIWELAAMSFNGPTRSQKDKDLMQRIMFLCDCPAEFLEINKINYRDAIEAAERGTTRVEL